MKDVTSERRKTEEMTLRRRTLLSPEKEVVEGGIIDGLIGAQATQVDEIVRGSLGGWNRFIGWPQGFVEEELPGADGTAHGGARGKADEELAEGETFNAGTDGEVACFQASDGGTAAEFGEDDVAGLRDAGGEDPGEDAGAEATTDDHGQSFVAR